MNEFSFKKYKNAKEQTSSISKLSIIAKPSLKIKVAIIKIISHPNADNKGRQLKLLRFSFSIELSFIFLSFLTFL